MVRYLCVDRSTQPGAYNFHAPLATKNVFNYGFVHLYGAKNTCLGADMFSALWLFGFRVANKELISVK